MGDYYGTLAAARCYGRADIPVFLADASRFTQTRWSRYVTRSYDSPPLTDLNAFGDFLLDFGKREPGLFLYATSDDLAWLLASRREQLSKYFRMYQPPLSTIMALLDKRKLYEACHAVGLATPATLFPESERSLAASLSALSYPVLIKPRTQVLFPSKRKGMLVRSRDELARAYPSFRAENPYGEELLAYDPSISWPMLQRYHAEAMVDTYSMSGFIDRSGELFVLRAARKAFQRPRQVGVGLCFIGEPVHPELREKLFALCQSTGYFGAFEAEFVRVGDQHMFIDFNPRFFGQMGFDVARGMPLPSFAYHAAHGIEGEALRNHVPHRDEPADAASYRYSHRWLLELLMLTQSLSGRLPRTQRQTLQTLLDDPRGSSVDAVRDEEDRGPLVADVLVSLAHFARHPRDFIRKFFLED